MNTLETRFTAKGVIFEENGGYSFEEDRMRIEIEIQKKKTDTVTKVAESLGELSCTEVSSSDAGDVCKG